MADITTADLRSQLAAATRILAGHQLVGMFGHVSVLTDDPQTYLVCPGAGARKDRCRASDVIELDLDHEFTPGPPLELYMHSEVHRLKPHIKSLIHVHSPALVALAAMAEVPTDG
jgi:ribulose-5-phosphate 4-epimerase/fuculose-1-phosphate aldolase